MTIDELAWGEDGLLPVVIEDAAGGGVLTLAYANREALTRTLAERTTWLFSRSRGRLWKKGETSGHVQTVVDVRFDCDNDALLYRVSPHGPACHTGAASCFAASLLGDPAGDVPEAGGPGGDSFARALEHLGATIAARRGASPESSYTAKLLAGGVDRIAKKVGEEATEVVIAAKNGAPDEIAWEVADLFYHTLVLLEERGVSLESVGAELLRRAK